MPKAGQYDYPSRDLDDAIERARRIYDVTKSDVVKREIAAQALGMSMGGGGFNTTIASLEIYGLIDTGGGEIKFTELAKTIFFGEPSEVAEAKTRAVRNVKLFADLCDTYGADVTDEQLRVFLRQRAMVEMEKVAPLAAEISRLFKRVSQYLHPAIKAAEEQKAVALQQGFRGDRRVETLPPNIVRLAYRDFVVDVPDDDIEIIESQFNTMLAYLKKKRGSPTQEKEAS